MMRSHSLSNTELKPPNNPTVLLNILNLKKRVCLHTSKVSSKDPRFKYKSNSFVQPRGQTN